MDVILLSFSVSSSKQPSVIAWNDDYSTEVFYYLLYEAKNNFVEISKGFIVKIFIDLAILTHLYTTAIII